MISGSEDGSIVMIWYKIKTKSSKNLWRPTFIVDGSIKTLKWHVSSQKGIVISDRNTSKTNYVLIVILYIYTYIDSMLQSYRLSI